MDRDGYTEDEARNMVLECRQHCLNEIEYGNIAAPFDIIIDELGLGGDYLVELLF